MPYVYNPLLDAGLDQTGAGASTPGGSTTQIQFNNAGSFGGISTLTYDGSILTTSGRFVNSYNATASAPAKAFTGTWFTGGSATTTKPQVLIEPTGTTSTGWSTAGTGFGVNAASGFAGRLLDLQLNGTSRVVVTGAGNVGIGTTSPASALTVSAGSLTPYFDFKAAAGYEYGSFSNSSGTVVGYLGIASSTASGGANTDFAVRSQQNLLFCGGGNTERARIDSSGRLLVGTSTANTSGAKLQTSDGITFPATQVASADPNTLDDYEEGTWTPTIIGSTTAGTGTYTNQVGKYTKIGGIVYVEAYLSWTAHTGTGSMWLGNLPFTTSATLTGPGVSFGRIQNITLTAGYVLLGYVAASSTTAPLRQYPVGGGAEASVPIDTAGEVNFSVAYTVV